MLYFIICIIIILFFLSIKGNNFKDNKYKGITSDTSICIKAILALIIIIHHLSFQYKTNIIFSQFSIMGTICVALFFFLSGYGLMKQSLLSKKLSKKRFSKLLPPFILATILYSIYSLETNSWQYIANRLVKGFPPLPTSWFVYAICWFYITFYYANKFTQSIISFNIFMFIATCLYCFIILIILKWEGWWINASFAFNIGVAIASFEYSTYIKRINTFCYNILAILLTTISIFAIVYKISVIYNLTICILTWLALSKLECPYNKLLQVIGEYSYEIYLVQGATIAILANTLHISTLSPSIGLILTFITTFILAYLLKHITHVFSKRLKLS